MIPSKAIKVYRSSGEPIGDHVTTVFTAQDAYQVMIRLFKLSNVRRVIFTSVTGKVLRSVTENEAAKL